jgi:hypothetical protein
MNKLILAALMVMGTMAAPLNAPTAAQAAAPGVLVCDNDRAHPYTGTYQRVTVPRGASCYLKNAVVNGNLKALHGARNVVVLNTEVGRNIHIRGAKRNVRIGVVGCRFDPPVGNNIKVTRSHNVLICFMTVRNNIMVTRNDGRITLLHNDAGRNINVSNNLAFDRKPGDGHHRRIAAIRLRGNEAGSHIFVRGNDGRGLISRNNSPAPIT